MIKRHGTGDNCSAFEGSWKTQFFWVGHFDFFFFQKKNFFAFFPWKLVKVYWLARMAQNFDQAKRDNTFWPTPNILGGSVSTRSNQQTP